MLLDRYSFNRGLDENDRPPSIARCRARLGSARASVWRARRLSPSSASASTARSTPRRWGYPPSGVPRRLVLGQDVVFNERITTEAGGQTQILFVDESTLSVGPNANMVIDQFVYDPNAGTGKFAASLTRGVFRFVGGKLSKQDNAVTMRTPTATIGIRGGVMLVDLAPGGTALGHLRLRQGRDDNRAQRCFADDHSAGIRGLRCRGRAPHRPTPPRAPPGATAALLAQLDGRAGGTGGAPIIPTEIMVANSGIANVISAKLTASIQAAAHAQPPAQQAQNVSPAVQQTQLNNQNASVPGATVTPVTGGSSVAIGNYRPSSQGLRYRPRLRLATSTPSPTRPVIPIVVPPTIPPVVIPPITIPTIPSIAATTGSAARNRHNRNRPSRAPPPVNISDRRRRLLRHRHSRDGARVSAHPARPTPAERSLTACSAPHSRLPMARMRQSASRWSPAGQHWPVRRRDDEPVGRSHRCHLSFARQLIFLR